MAPIRRWTNSRPSISCWSNRITWPTRAYFKEVPAGVLTGENRAWGSSVIDHTAPAWPDFPIERILAPLWERGYRGFFLDTLDSYHLISATPAARAVQEAAMVATLRRCANDFRVCA